MTEKIKSKGYCGLLELGTGLAEFTSFKAGGPADCLTRPAGIKDLQVLLAAARESGLPVTVLGAGANILVSDRGIRGIVVLMSGFTSFETYGSWAVLGAGLPVTQAAGRLADRGLACLETFYAMPGSIGGSLWMNARCYGASFSDNLLEVAYVDKEGTLGSMTVDPSSFGYKKSPFQQRQWTLVEASFRVRKADPRDLWKTMRELEADRTSKGHFLAPSVGSIFKNNRDFGEPTGAILDRLGFRGFRHGGAQVSPRHGNIVLNVDRATAGEIRELIELLQQRAYQERGFRLEPEVLYLGEW